jgi:hypothetical protein
MASIHESLPEKIPSLDDVTTAYQEVLQYNKKHTGISTGILNLLKATIESEEAFEESATTFEASLEQANTEDAMHKELTHIMHANTLRCIGVSLQNGSQLRSSTGSPVGAQKLTPRIDDAESFRHFLSLQSKDIIQSDIKYLDLVVDLLKDLENQVSHGFAPFPATTDSAIVEPLMLSGEMALKTFDYINDELLGLELDKPEIFKEILKQDRPVYINDHYQTYLRAEQYRESYEELENFVHYWGQDLLQQYIRVGHEEKLKQEKYVYLDGEQMNNRLIKLTAYILDMAKNEKENVRKYGIESANNLLQGVQKTINRMIIEPDVWYASPYNKILLQSIELDIVTTVED